MERTARGPGGQRTCECLGLGLRLRLRLQMKQEDCWQRRIEGQQTVTWLLLVQVQVQVLDLREKRELVFPVNHALKEYFDVH